MNKINAKYCNIIDFTKQPNKVNKFIETNHLQGNMNYYLAYGLVYKDDIVQMITLGKPRYRKDYQWELIRDCTKKDYVIIGGISKLWKYFIENNSVRSCICYSYPCNKNDVYTNKYVDHCEFTNLEKAKSIKKISFEGLWKDKEIKIENDSLQHHGIDRILGTKFDRDGRSNEQILLDLGFEKKEENVLTPQIDSYFPFGIVYRIDDLDDGSFYIGETTNKSGWDDGYLGTGSNRWKNHKKKHPPIEKEPNNPNAHHYKRIILHKDCKTPKELYKLERKEIRKYGKCIDEEKDIWESINPKLMNESFKLQGEHHLYPSELYKKQCSECGGKGCHKKTCSKYTTTICKECNGLHGKHRKECSHYKQKEACSECGSIGVNHKKSCSKYKEQQNCSECGGIGNRHRKTCSQYKTQVCNECGGLNGKHKDLCSKSKGACDHCGYSIQSNRHAKDCPLYKERKNPTPCKFCGSLTIHKKFCPKYVDPGECPECGYNLRSHKHSPECSYYKKLKKCNECGSIGSHKKHCSQYKHKDPCCECGVSKGPHKLWCSKSKGVKVCEECNGRNGKHYVNCSQYKPKPVCSECNGKNGHHYKTCSKYKK